MGEKTQQISFRTFKPNDRLKSNNSLQTTTRQVMVFELITVVVDNLEV